MTEARRSHFSLKEAASQASWERNQSAFPPAPEADRISRLLNLREVQNEFGLSKYAIYAAVQRGQLDPMQVGGKGRIYYSETQIRRALAGQYRLSRSAA